MSFKSKLSNGFLLFSSMFSIALKKLTGTNIRFSAFTLVSPLVTLKTDSKGKIIIGNMVGIRKNSEISAKNGIVRIEDNCFINCNCMIVAHNNIEIGKGTTIGPNSCIYDHDHSSEGEYTSSPIKIGRDVWIGANCVILKGVVIGDYCTIGAGSLITKNIPNNCTVIQKRKNTIIDKSG